MVECIIQDTSTVTVNGSTVTGPVHFVADEITHSTTEYTDGVVIVNAGALVEAAKLSRFHVEAAPYAYLLYFCLGSLAALAWFRR